jgi:hypothetical protein
MPGHTNLGGRLYVVGGGLPEGGTTGSLQEYDPATDTWQQLEELTVARTTLGVASANGKIYAVGGSNSSGRLAILEVFSFDADGDGFDDGLDNCPAQSNPDQTNTDGDGQGDACDADDDNDGVPDASDNCSLSANADQLDTDHDGQGDACDPDDDNDSVSDGNDNCPLTANFDQVDSDGDQIGDACDTPSLIALGPSQLWLGLKNSDAVGLRVDVRTEVLINGNVVGAGEVQDLPTGSSGFNNAILQTIQVTLIGGPADIPPGSQLSFRSSVRRTCFGGGHNSGTVRLWFDGQPIDAGPGRDAASRFRVTINQATSSQFLRSGFSLSPTPGTVRQFRDAAVNSSAACPARPFTAIGTWSTAVP